jgi:hypothetical protein
MVETWKDIPRYEGIYQASSHGRIRTHKDKTTHRKGCKPVKWKQRILKYKGETPKTGYRVSLWKDGKPKDFLVSRLVCTTFYDDRINDKITVNHKDGNRMNNHIENLEWVSLGDNIRHAFKNNLIKTQKQIKITHRESNTIGYFMSMTRASESIGRTHGYISGLIKKNRWENETYKWGLIDWEEYSKHKEG